MERFRVRVLGGIKFDYSIESVEWNKLTEHIQKLRALSPLHDDSKYREIALMPDKDSLCYRLREWEDIKNYKSGNSKFFEKIYTPEEIESI